jgi:hypothetical protein
MINQILITQSTHQAMTYFLFRPIGNDSYLEIQIEINKEKQLIKSTENLTPTEANYIRENIFNGNFLKKNINYKINIL